MPQSWDQDRDRCREAGLPDTVVYRPQWPIALERYDRAVHKGLHVEGLTFDAGSGSKPALLREGSARQQRYVAEVARSCTGCLKAPRVVTRPYHRGRRGRGRRVPRLARGSRPARRVEALLNERVLGDQPWPPWRVKDGAKGPLVGEGKHTLRTVKNEPGLPAERLHLGSARNVLAPNESTCFVSNAPPGTGSGARLLVALARWRVARCLADDKSEVGLEPYQGRRYLGLKRQLVLSAVR